MSAESDAITQFEECEDASQLSGEAATFVVNALNGNFGPATGDWVEAVMDAARNGTGCFGVLTQGQRDAIYNWLHDNRAKDHHEAK